MTVLGQRALNRALLERQLLLRRRAMPVPAAVEHLVGLQAQEPPAPYIGLWSRLEDLDADAAGALVERRELVRMGLMRWTMHMVTARDALRLRPVLQETIEKKMLGAMRRYLEGVDLDELAAAAEVLVEDEPRSATEAARVLHERFPQSDVQTLSIAIAALLPLVQLPPRGVWGRKGRVVLTTLDQWVGHGLAFDHAPDALVPRYLAAFGPATPGDMRLWSGLSGLREVFERLRPSLVTYEDERGRELFDVPGAPLPDPDTPAPVRFLPPFDNAVLGHDDRTRIMDAERQRLVVGGASFVLVDGFAAAQWRVVEGHESATLLVDPFRDLTAEEAAEVEREGRALLRLVAAGAAAHAVRIG